MAIDPILTIDSLRRLSRVRSLCRSGAARKIRLGANVSMGEVARTASISTATLSRYERNLRSPHGAAGERYASVLEDLLTGEPQ